MTLSLRVTLTQREKLARLGGAEWVRGKVDKAKEPNVGVIVPADSPVAVAARKQLGQ